MVQKSKRTWYIAALILAACIALGVVFVLNAHKDIRTGVAAEALPVFTFNESKAPG